MGFGSTIYKKGAQEFSGSQYQQVRTEGTAYAEKLRAAWTRYPDGSMLLPPPIYAKYLRVCADMGVKP